MNYNYKIFYIKNGVTYTNVVLNDTPVEETVANFVPEGVEYKVEKNPNPILPVISYRKVK